MSANKKQKTEVVQDKESDFDGYLSFALFQDALSGKATDLTFHVGPSRVPIKAHSVVLKRTSVVFDVMLSEPWKRGQELALPEDDPEDFRLFLKLLYGYKRLAASAYEDVFAVVCLADKYDSVPVQNVLSRYATGLVNNKLTVANVVPMYQSAKVYDSTDYKILNRFKEGAKKFILKNINEMWKRAEWLELDEDDVIFILSQDQLYHVDCVKVASGSFCNCGRRTCCSSSSAQKRRASNNEVLVLDKAVDWIKHQKLGKKNVGVMRVLKHIRFDQICEGDLKGVLGRLGDTLRKSEMGEILLARYGIASGSSDFVSFGKPRALPIIHTLHYCRRCGRLAACSKTDLGYRCYTCRHDWGTPIEQGSADGWGTPVVQGSEDDWDPPM